LIISESLAAFGARAALFSRVSRDKKTLELMASANTAEDIAAPFRSLPMDAAIPNSRCAREGRPFYFESRDQMMAEFPTLARSRISDDTHAVMCLPLVAGAEMLGVLTLTFDADREFSPDDRTFAMALAQQAALALQRGLLLQTDRLRQQRDAFLARASAILASSIDHEETLSALAKLVVPELADWCGIEIAGEAGAPSRQLVVAHVDPKKVAFAIELREKYPPRPDSPYGLPNIFRTGKSELYGTITDDLLVRGAVDDEHLRISRALGMTSVMLVPLKVRDQVAGVLTLVSAEGDRHYDDSDLALVEELARRAGTAMEHARLYREAKEAVAFRDDFLAVASHDLRTPLSTMKLQLDVMLHGKDAMVLDAANKKRFDRIDRAATSLTLLINKLLDVSNINFGRLKLECEPVDIVQVVRDVLERLQDEAIAAKCTLKLTASQLRIVGRWDKIRLDQIVTNLVTNAIKYGREHPIEVELSADPGQATLCIRDHGIGIAPANQSRIFARFERAVSGRSYSGMGIGLWIVKKLVIAHGGSIDVKSELGAGAVFTVSLPVSVDDGEGAS
jgi:signal transduction histidine kinase